jgi:hypothetical protein
MKLFSLLALSLSLCSFISASFDDYVLLKSFSLVPDDEYYYLHILPISGDEIKAAKFSMKDMSSEFLDELSKSKDSKKLPAKIISIYGKYKVYLPSGVIIGFSFQKPNKILKVTRLSENANVLTATVDHFIYEEPVTLSNRYFYHRNWWLSFRTHLLTPEDYRLIALPDSVFYKVINDVALSYTHNIELTAHSVVAFQLEGGHRFVTMTIDLERTAVVCTDGGCTSSDYFAVSVLAVDNTSKASKILSQYTKIDNHAYFIPRPVIILFWIMGFIVGVCMYCSGFGFYVGFFLVYIPFYLIKFIIDCFYDRGPSKSELIKRQ